MTTYTITADQLASISASRLQHLDRGDEAAADALDWVLTAEPSGWRPIETAPKDEDVLLYCDHDQFMGEAFFDHAESDCWCWASGLLVVSPSRWQPLPQPPEA